MAFQGGGIPVKFMQIGEGNREVSDEPKRAEKEK
jgi:hypothetical protein